MPQRIPRRTLLATGAAGLAGLAGCNALGGGGDGDDELGGDSGTNDPGTTTVETVDQGWTVPMGMIRPTEGSLSAFGEEMKMAADLAVEQVDASPTQYAIDMTIKDTDGTAEAAVQAATELVDEGIRIIVGPASDGATLAVAEDVVIDEQIVAISPVAGAEEINELDTAVSVEAHNQPIELQYLTAPTAAQNADRLGKHIARQRDTYETIGILYEDNAYGASVDSQTTPALEQRGVTVNSHVSVPPDADSYATQLEELMADDPDGVVLAANPSTGIDVLQDWYADYGETPVIMCDRLLHSSVPEALDHDMEGDVALGRQPVWMEEQPSERTVNEVDSIEEPFHWAWLYKYNDWPSIQAAQTYDAILPMFLSALRAREDDYNGPEISYEIQNTANRQEDTGGITTAGVDFETFFTSNSAGEPYLLAIADGLVNDYIGPTGGVNFSAEGVMGAGNLELWHFNADTLWGYRMFDLFA